MKHLIAMLLIVSFAATADDSNCVKDQYGKVLCGKGECAADEYKKVFCAPQGGTAVKNRYGKVICGAGQCAKDSLDQLWCSNEPGGGAARDGRGQVKCLGGCALATAELCEEGK